MSSERVLDDGSDRTRDGHELGFSNHDRPNRPTPGVRDSQSFFLSPKRWLARAEPPRSSGPARRSTHTPPTFVREKETGFTRRSAFLRKENTLFPGGLRCRESYTTLPGGARLSRVFFQRNHVQSRPERERESLAFFSLFSLGVKLARGGGSLPPPHKKRHTHFIDLFREGRRSRIADSASVPRGPDRVASNVQPHLRFTIPLVFEMA